MVRKNVAEIFDRRITRRTPGRFRTRVLTEGVVPSLHVEYKKSKVKQYHKDGQALRTETTINNTYDFAIGRALRNLPALREIGFTANRRLLHVESLSHDCLIGEDALDAVSHPVVVQDQRAAGLHFGDRRVHALMHALCLFALAPTSFRHRELRDHVAPLLARDPATYPAGAMTYDLRRLRLHRLERVPRCHRYRITPTGAQVAMFYVRLYTRALRPACSLPPVGLTPCAARLCSARRRARPFPRGGQTCGLKNLTQTLILLGVKTPSHKPPPSATCGPRQRSGPVVIFEERHQ